MGFPGGIIFPTGPGIGATQDVCAVISLIRAVGNIDAFTVMEPLTIMPGPPGTQPGSIQGAVLHSAVAAGLPPIITVGFPSINASGRPGWGTGVGTGAGGWIGAWQCGASCLARSPMDTAGGIKTPNERERHYKGIISN